MTDLKGWVLDLLSHGVPFWEGDKKRRKEGGGGTRSHSILTSDGQDTRPIMDGGITKEVTWRSPNQHQRATVVLNDSDVETSTRNFKVGAPEVTGDQGLPGQPGGRWYGEW